MLCGRLIVALLYIGGITISGEVVARPLMAIVNMHLPRPEKENIQKSWPFQGTIPMQSPNSFKSKLPLPIENDGGLNGDSSMFQITYKQWGKGCTKSPPTTILNSYPNGKLTRQVRIDDNTSFRGLEHNVNKMYVNGKHFFPRLKRTVDESMQSSLVLEQEHSRYEINSVSEKLDKMREQVDFSTHLKKRLWDALGTNSANMGEKNHTNAASKGQIRGTSHAHRAMSNNKTDSQNEYVVTILDSVDEPGSIEVDKRSSTQDGEDMDGSQSRISSSESSSENNGGLNDDDDSESELSDDEASNEDAQTGDKTPSGRHHLGVADGDRNRYPALSHGGSSMGNVYNSGTVNRTDLVNETTDGVTFDQKEMTTDPTTDYPSIDDHNKNEVVTTIGRINETDSGTIPSEQTLILPTVYSVQSTFVSETRSNTSPNVIDTSTTSNPSTNFLPTISNARETENTIISMPQEDTGSLLGTLTTRTHVLLGRSRQTTVVSTSNLSPRSAFQTATSVSSTPRPSSTQATAYSTDTPPRTLSTTNGQQRTTTVANTNSTTTKLGDTTSGSTNSQASQVPTKIASTLLPEQSPVGETTIAPVTTTTPTTTTTTTTAAAEPTTITTEAAATTTIVAGGEAPALTTITFTLTNVPSLTSSQTPAVSTGNSTKVIPTIPERNDNPYSNENADERDRRYVRLKLSMATDEFCQSWDIIRQDLLVVLNWDEEDRVTTDQVVLIDGDTWCQEANEDTGEDHVIVVLYLVDLQRRYDRVLTTRCARYLSQGGPPLTSTSILHVKLMEAQLVWSTSVAPHRGGQPTIGGHTWSGIAAGTTRNGDATDQGGNNHGEGGGGKKYAREAEEQGSDPGVIAAIVLAAIGVVCCLIVVALQTAVRRRHFLRQTLARTVTRSPSVTSTGSIQLASVTKSRPNSGLFNPGLDIVDSMEPSHPMTYPQLVDFCSDLGRVAVEFEKLPNRMPRLSVVPTGEEEKNRFANILPLALTRVKLLQDGHEPRSSYINANYITGPDSQCQYYIATQAPTDTTAADFWTMVWQQSTKAIIMLTQLEEDGQTKCFPYWPDLVGKSAAQRHGDYLVELKHREVHQEYIASQLEINNLPKIESRTVYHFWCTSWPSQGLPEPITLVKLVIDCRTKYEDSGTPVIVHCSPGTGRTGSYIALDLCMHQFETRRTVDIMKTVYTMRQERAGSVQNKEQYTLLYQAAREYASIIESPGISAASSATTLHALLQSS